MRCWAEVDLTALRENLAWIRHAVGPTVKIMTVVKADAYGHGLKQIAALLMQSGTDIFGVANLAEAQSIRSVGKGWPILMLGACLPDEAELAVREGVTCTLSTLEEAKRLSAAAKKLNKTAFTHLKIDTGMGRLGVAADQAAALWAQIEQLSHLKIQGLYTHFSSAEDDPAYTLEQKKRFRRALSALVGRAVLSTPADKVGRAVPNTPQSVGRGQAVPVPLLIHANNSAGLLFDPDTLYNTVRPGLLVYGVLPPGKRRAQAELVKHFRPALAWKCRVSLVKEITSGTPLSYGRSFVARKKMRIATLTAGYGDGYLRAASNQAKVLVRERLCPVVGRITMDQMIIDVSSLPKTEPGDEAVLIGRQGARQITAADLAQWSGTIPWEVLTNITYRVPRIYRGTTAA